MAQSKILKVKKWIDLNEAAERLSLSLEEHINALDLMELALDGEVTLSVKFPRNELFYIREVAECESKYIDDLEKDFKFHLFAFNKENASKQEVEKMRSDFIMEHYQRYVQAAKKNGADEIHLSYDYFMNELMSIKWSNIGNIEIMEEFVYELPLIGAEKLHIEKLVEINNERHPGTLTSLDSVFLKSKSGKYYILNDRFKDESESDKTPEPNKAPESLEHILNKNKYCYFPAGELPEDVIVGMAPIDLAEFERKLSSSDKDLSLELAVKVLGAVLKEVTTKAKKWTQDDLASTIDERKIPGLRKRVVNGTFSYANKSFKSDS